MDAGQEGEYPPWKVFMVPIQQTAYRLVIFWNATERLSGFRANGPRAHFSE